MAQPAAILLTPINIIFASFFLAIAGAINDLTDSANKVGTLGMQGLLALLLIALGYVIVHQDRRRTVDREERDKLLLKQYDTLLKHHDAFAAKADLERMEFHAAMRGDAQELKGLTERSMLSMHAMATAVDALREYLKDRHSLPISREQARKLSIPEIDGR